MWEKIKQGKIHQLNIQNFIQKGSLIILLLIFGTTIIVNRLSFVKEDKKTTSAQAVTAKEQLNLQKLRDRARSMTVKVIVGENASGSGFLIQKQDNRYRVVTNQHVLVSSQKNTYKIETVDGKVHAASLVNSMEFSGKDLAVLEFTSSSDYAIAPLGDSQQIKVGQTVIAAGFPFKHRSQQTAQALEINQGKISLLPSQALAEGYKIGYTNTIKKGMSGGPLLNLKGEVIAINGMHSHPLWGDPYVYKNGEKPSEAMRERMRELSWAISIKNLKAAFTQS